MKMTRRKLLFAGAAVAAQTQVRAQAGKTVNVALIGAGHRAWAHIAVLKAIPEFRIAGIADPTPQFLQQAVALAGPGVPVYADYRQMLAERKDLQAVFVVTPSGLHAEPAVACLQRGLSVLCEKPMATTMADAARVIDAAERAGTVLQIGLQMRCTPHYQKILELVRSGEVGSVQFVSWNLFRGDWNPQSWRVVDPKTGQPTIWRLLTKYTGSSLLEDGIHEIDVVNWIVGSRVKQVYATGGNNVFKNRETIDHASVVMEYENGVKFQLGFSLFAPPAGSPGRALTLIGTDGVVNLEPWKLVLRKPAAEPRDVEVASGAPAELLNQAIGRDLDAGTYRQALAFLESVRTGRKPVCDGQAGRDAMRVSLLAELSLREHRVVGWNDLPV
jgi:predicted dehydrogenase